MLSAPSAATTAGAAQQPLALPEPLCLLPGLSPPSGSCRPCRLPGPLAAAAAASPAQGGRQGRGRPLFWSRVERLLLLLALFPTLFAPRRLPLPLLFSPLCVLLPQRLGPREPRNKLMPGADRAKWLPRAAATAGAGVRGPRFGQGCGSAAGGGDGGGTDGRAACCPCARVRGRRRCAAGGPGSPGGGKVVTSALAERGSRDAGPYTPLLPLHPRPLCPRAPDLGARIRVREVPIL